jgi:hypothetical protein
MAVRSIANEWRAIELDLETTFPAHIYSERVKDEQAYV